MSRSEANVTQLEKFRQPETPQEPLWRLMLRELRRNPSGVAFGLGLAAVVTLFRPKRYFPNLYPDGGVTISNARIPRQEAA